MTNLIKICYNNANEIGSENMTRQFVIDYINKKEQENENYIRYTFYELKVKNNLSEDEIDIFLQINRDYFENKGYNVYFTGAKFTYQNCNRVVELNELMIAIKEKEGDNQNELNGNIQNKKRKRTTK